LASILAVSPALAGISITPTNGIVMTGADGIVMTGADGIVMTGADSFLNAGTNGIVMTGADGIVMTGADGIVMTGADGIVMTGADGFAYPNSIRMTGSDGFNVANASSVVLTGTSGIVMTGADNTTYHADSVTLAEANGMALTAANETVITGTDGAQQTGDSVTTSTADGIVMTGADTVFTAGAATVQVLGANGSVFSVVPSGFTFSGVTGIVMTGADGIVTTGSEGVVLTGPDGVVITDQQAPTNGLLSVDPELALTLNQITDDSGVNAVVVYHHLPTEADLQALQTEGINGGTRFHVVPAILVTANRNQLMAISRLPGVRSIYSNRTLTLTSEPEVRSITGVDRAWADTDITGALQGLPVSGRNVTVAVLDTGIDGTHTDVSGRVTRNVRMSDTQSAVLGFQYPNSSGNLANTDPLNGHGSFVAGIIAGNGNHSGGKYRGVAPGANLVGINVGDLSLFHVLAGMDYLLANNAELGVKVVNCSFSANTVFDANDPVNVASKLLTEAGINVVFSAGNTGPGADTLNPYAVAPWVISVGATDSEAKLADFSSRGHFANSFFKPTLVAPGVNVVSLRGAGIANITGLLGLVGSDLLQLTSTELPFYTTATGTSFSAPQVSGAIALMLEANPSLTPAKIREILQRTATPLAPYYAHETGAGMLNVHAAVLEAAFSSRRIGKWRGTLDRGQVEFFNDPLVTFSGTLQSSNSSYDTLTMPSDALISSVQIGWGPFLSVSDLSLDAYAPNGSLEGQSNDLNVPGLTGRRERIVLTKPAAGPWRLKVKNMLGFLAPTQPYSGVLEVGRARYATMTDVNSLSPSLRDDIYQSLRTFSMWPIGSRFRPDATVSRRDFAAAMVMGARVPQYLAGSQMFQDVNGEPRLFVESAQSAPGGALFLDVQPGGQFRPYDGVTRLAAAVALVRAAGLRTQAENQAGALLPFLDGLSIPHHLRGYVAVANSHGFIQSDMWFRPNSSFTRGDLARALAAIQNSAQ
jgi:serine protease AprX